MHLLQLSRYGRYLQARERQLMGDVTVEQQQGRDLSIQLQALQEAMEEIKKMVGFYTACKLLE